MIDLIRVIAEGGEFDPVEAIRALARMQLLQGAAEPPVTIEDGLVALVGAKVARALAQAGYGDTRAVAAASDEQLAAIDGVSARTVAQIREKLARLSAEPPGGLT